MVNIKVSKELTDQEYDILKRGLNELCNEYFSLTIHWLEEGNMENKEECEKRYKEYETLLNVFK